MRLDGDMSDTPADHPKSRRPLLTGCLVVAGLVIGLPAACVAAVSLSGGDEWEPTAIEARLICEEWVRGRLVSPSTAAFNDGATAGGPTAYTVTGTVDSENALGGTVRTDWTCDAEYRDADQKWHGGADID